MNTSRLILLILVFVFFAFDSPDPCKEIKSYSTPVGNTIMVRKFVKTYLNCNDTTSFIDSVYDDNILAITFQYLNNKENGKTTYYNKNGEITTEYFYNDGEKTKSIEYENNKILEEIFFIKEKRNKIINYHTRITEEWIELNDSLQKYRMYDIKNRVIEEGNYEKHHKIGKWIIYDTLTQNKIIANYIPANKTIEIEHGDYVKGVNKPSVSIITVEGIDELLDGKWEKYNKEGVLVETKIYKQGIEVKTNH